MLHVGNRARCPLWSVLVLAVGLFLLLLIDFSAFASEANCDAIELMPGYPDYNRAVCEGYRALENNRYSTAVRSFEKASQFMFLEFPNFQLYSAMAWAHFLAGERSEAAANLEKARLSLALFTGLIHCTDDGIVGADQHLVDSKYNEEVTAEMCGEIYQGLYGAPQFEYPKYTDALLQLYVERAKLVEKYLEVDAGIRSGQ